MTLRSLILLAPLAVLGCTADPDGEKTVDSDGDGLSDTEEAGFGTDPSVADTDGDGLLDAEEYAIGTNGTLPDTDADTYTDKDEVDFGTSPLDGEDRIYTGYWPYNPNKDAITDPGMSEKAKEGRTFARFTGPDQFGETVDLYDYAGHGKLTVVDLSGVWCYYCNEMAKWLEGKRSFFDDYADQATWITGLVDLVNDGTVQWVTILDADASYNSIEVDEQAAWAEDYDNPNVAVLGDADVVLADYLRVRGYPTLIVFDENMVIASYDNDYFVNLQYAYDNASGM